MLKCLLRTRNALALTRSTDGRNIAVTEDSNNRWLVQVNVMEYATQCHHERKVGGMFYGRYLKVQTHAASCYDTCQQL